MVFATSRRRGGAAMSASSVLVIASVFLLATATHAFVPAGGLSGSFLARGIVPSLQRYGRASLGLRMVATSPQEEETLPPAAWMAPGQKFGPQSPGQPWSDKPYDNLSVPKNKPEYAKKDSAHLRFPLQQEMADTETIDISHDAIIVLKHHGSYMQQNRDLQRSDKAGYAASYQFMLRLKVPCGKLPASVYQTVDDITDKWGQGDIRATTRQAWQIHGVKKHNLKAVIAAIANAGGSTLGGCGDINRNIVTPPAPLADPAYQYAFQTGNYIADLFAPSSPAFAELWMDGKKATTVEYWKKDMVHGSGTSTSVIPPVSKSIDDLNAHMSKTLLHDNGNGIITGDPEEPIYGRQYLPRKFKMAVTVPGDNSIDVFIHDVSLVVIMNPDGKTLKGYDIYVGGGMGRTHNKESTFARVAEPLGFVTKDDLPELLKAILATQRDHGNREVRANARLKYLVHTLGIDNFRKLVESYYGKKVGKWVPLPAWRMVDWMGWHEQGDGKLFLGVIVQQGRIKNEGGLKIKTALRMIVDKYGLDTRLTADQNIVLCGIDPKDRADIDKILATHGVKPIEEVDMMTRKSIACPAFPLCGLAQAEAERAMPSFNARVSALLTKMGMPGESFVMRMTGCPNGCARPYMAELSFVGQGPDLYQTWMGGSSQLDGRTGWTYKDKVKAAELEQELEPILYMWKSQRTSTAERFGDFLNKVGKDAVVDYVAKYTPGTAFKNVKVEELYTGPVVTAKRGSSGPRKQQIRVTDELHAALKEKADASGIPLSDLVEDIIMSSM